jgi:hypothetical protein
MVDLDPELEDLVPATCTELLADPPTQPPRIYAFLGSLPKFALSPSGEKIVGVTWSVGGSVWIKDTASNFLADPKILPDLRRMYGFLFFFTDFIVSLYAISSKIEASDLIFSFFFTQNGFFLMNSDSRIFRYAPRIILDNPRFDALLRNRMLNWL